MLNNPYAKVPEKMAVTAAAAEFVETVQYEDIPGDAIRIGTRCVLDGLGLFVSGSDEHSVRILAEDTREQGGHAEARLLGCGDVKVPAAMAARVLGTSGHAHDWDDSQVSLDPDHVYGLLTHPTIPPLSSTLVTTQKVGGVSGKDFRMDVPPALQRGDAFFGYRRDLRLFCSSRQDNGFDRRATPLGVRHCGKPGGRYSN